MELTPEREQCPSCAAFDGRHHGGCATLRPPETTGPSPETLRDRLEWTSRYWHSRHHRQGSLTWDECPWQPCLDDRLTIAAARADAQPHEVKCRATGQHLYACVWCNVTPVRADAQPRLVGLMEGVVEAYKATGRDPRWLDDPHYAEATVTLRLGAIQACHRLLATATEARAVCDDTQDPSDGWEFMADIATTEASAGAVERVER